MGKKCCVPGCTGNYEKSGVCDRVSVFKFPKDPPRKDLWLSKIHYQERIIPHPKNLLCVKDILLIASLSELTPFQLKIEELGRVLCQVCHTVPGGIVCFFPSYDYERFVLEAWTKSGSLAKLQARKKIFREPKRNGLADQVLAEYSECIKRCATWQGTLTGAVLMCVVGGKMSEGINFSDDLGRCIVMVGLPFPNIKSPELKEKMSYLNANFPKDADGKQAGQVHYENICMKAVNQSIGRAIRHKDDYASILLLDQRFMKHNISSKLPGWISKHLQRAEKFPLLLQNLRQFFATHKN